MSIRAILSPIMRSAAAPTPSTNRAHNVIIQPNSSPHVGTLCTLGLAFPSAHRLKACGLEDSVVCDLWDRAKAGESNIGDLIYHTTLRESCKYEANLPDYQELLRELGEVYKVEWRLRTEEEFPASKGMSEIVHGIIENRSLYAPSLASETGALAIRVARPQCGLVEKYYFAICGADYAGTWMEQLLWRFLKKPIIILTPMISDWSGAKSSKSRYLQRGAYDYLREAGQEYLLSYDVFKKENKSMKILRKEVELLIEDPFRLFREHSLHYLHSLFEGEFMAHGTKDKRAMHD